MRWHQKALASFDRGWSAYVEGLEEALDGLEADLDEAADMAGICTDEWCDATEHVIDELHKAVYSLSEPPFTGQDVSQRIKALRRKIHGLYQKYKAAVQMPKTVP